MLSDHCPLCLSVCLCCRVMSCPVCLSVTLVYCGQMVGRIKMKLGRQVGLVPGHIVLDGDPAPPPPERHSPPIFGPYLLRQMAAWVKMPLGVVVGLGPGDFVLDGDPAPLPKKGAEPPKFSAHVIVAKRLDGSRWYLAWR